MEKKTDDLSESDKLSEVFITPPKKSTEPNDFSPKFNEIGGGKENKEDTTPTNLEKKTDDLSESDKLSEVFKTPSEESPKIEEVVFNPERIEVEPPTSDSKQEEIDTTPTNLEKKTDDLSESDKLSEVFKTPSEESPKIEEVVFNPERIEVEPPTSDSKQEEIDTTPTNLEKKTDDLSESDKLSEVFITPPKKSTETEDVFPESREAKEDNKNKEDTTSTNLEKKTDDYSEGSSKIEEVFITPPKKSTEPNDFSPKFNEIDGGKENKEDTTPTNLEKKTDYYPKESPKIEEVVFNPEKIVVEQSTSDSEQEEMHSRPRLDKVLFRRVEKT